MYFMLVVLLLQLYYLFLYIRPPLTSTLFPYTTLSRSFINLRREDEVAFAQAPDGVRVDFYLRVAPAETDKNRSEEHTSELQSRPHLVCRLLLEKKKLN